MSHTKSRDALDRILRGAVDAGHAPAVAVAVVDRAETLYLGAAGVRDVANDRAATPDTIFRIASMTKPVTSLAAMMLVEQGALDLDAPVSTFLPEFDGVRVAIRFGDAHGSVESRPPTRPMLVRHLLTHTSGIAYSFMHPQLAKLDDGRTPQAELPLLHDPGDRFTYGPSTVVLGSLVEKLSGQTLGEFMRTRMFQPLGMADTGFAVPAAAHARAATVQRRENDRFTETANAATLASRGRGDDGLFSTASDFGKFMQLFLNGGVAGDCRLVRESTVTAMRSNQIGPLRIGEQPAAPQWIAQPFPERGSLDGFGLGFQIQSSVRRPVDDGLRSVGSYGWSGIFNTYFWIDPARELGVVVLMQFLPGQDHGALEIVHGVERLVYEC